MSEDNKGDQGKKDFSEIAAEVNRIFGLEGKPIGVVPAKTTGSGGPGASEEPTVTVWSSDNGHTRFSNLSHHDDLLNEKPDINIWGPINGRRLVAETVSLANALDRDKRFKERFVLVAYRPGEKLPDYYVPLSEYHSNDGTLFATINPDPFNRENTVDVLCGNTLHGGKGGSQYIGRHDMGDLPDYNKGDPNELIRHVQYLLGPGPEVVTLGELVDQQYDMYCKSHGISRSGAIR